MTKKFRFWVGVSLVLVYGVIAAGAVVRVTGSGMGCPDWPKCFGYLIPPTEREQLDWKPTHKYNKGEVIIVQENLRVAKHNFISSTEYSEINWNPYTKHDYAHFNAFHTWVEFINRLLGALAGLATLVVGIFSFKYWKKKKIIPFLSILVILGMGFQAWLGKVVVDSNLLPTKISIHMIMALFIVALLVYLYAYTDAKSDAKLKYPSALKSLGIIALTLTIVQIGMGIQVRQFIDTQIDLYGYNQKFRWLNSAPLNFYAHRSFSLLVIFINGYVFYKIKKLKFSFPVIKWVLLVIGLEICTGILMSNFDFPFASQPLHLLFASLLFGAQTYLLFQLLNQNLNK